MRGVMGSGGGERVGGGSRNLGTSVGNDGRLRFGSGAERRRTLWEIQLESW